MSAIYALCDPITGEVRYVGKADNPARRRELHIEQRHHKTHRGAWLRKLHSEGLKPSMLILEWVPRTQWEGAERYWIRQMRAFGCHLTNATAGGDGGYILAAHTPEARAKRAASQRGKSLSAETRAKIGAANAIALKGRPTTCPPPRLSGEQNYAAKLTDELVADLRRFVRAGGSRAAWADSHGVGRSAVTQAVSGRTWSHVSEPPVPVLVKQRLSVDDVDVIRELYASGEKQAAIVRRFGVDSSHISRIVRGVYRRREGGQ